jgi:hypothetical protein
MNCRMADALKDSPNTPETVALPAQLQELLDEGFCEMDDCVFFARFANRVKTASQSDFPDRTGYECFVNHVHVDDYLEAGAASAPLLATIGVAFARRLAEMLSARNGGFVVIVGSDDLSSSVRFHRARNGESWLSDDLESYRDEAIAVLETAPPRS